MRIKTPVLKARVSTQLSLLQAPRHLTRYMPGHIRVMRPCDTTFELTNIESHGAWLRPTVTGTFFLNPHPEELVWVLSNSRGNSFCRVQGHWATFSLS